MDNQAIIDMLDGALITDDEAEDPESWSKMNDIFPAWM